MAATALRAQTESFEMTISKPRRRSSPATKVAELSMAVPQVVAHRLTRMAIAGPVLNARDRKEFTGMVAEKQLAFSQAWVNILTETARMQQQFFMNCLTGKTWSQQLGSTRSALTRATNNGLAPIHRKAVSNAKRLARTKLR